ncbi:hypothetical protein J4727_12255 [Providencia rettgeri]|uniref:Uncharacterized protein n=1 Tax=Providencia rettgeri TaxID=587 RepID=A0A939SRF2_PRORE|nr:hypothetical protein [Providencia rettgeri]
MFTSYGFASDFTFKEKSPADREFNQDYQGIKNYRHNKSLSLIPKETSTRRTKLSSFVRAAKMQMKMRFQNILMCVMLTRREQGALIQWFG